MTPVVWAFVVLVAVCVGVPLVLLATSKLADHRRATAQPLSNQPRSLRCRCTVPPTDDPTLSQITSPDCPLHGLRPAARHRKDH